MFASLFSSKNKENIDWKIVSSSGVMSRVKSFAGKVSVILGLTTTNSMAIPGPSVPDIPGYAQEISVPASKLSQERLRTIASETTLPEKAPIIPVKEVGQIEPVSLPSKLRIATAQRGESVGLFMLKNFGTEEGWEFLVEKETGKRVRVATRDLIAGKMYVLARDEKEAHTLANIFKKQLVKKNNPKTEVAPVARRNTEKIEKTSISYNYFAAPKEDFYSIAKKVWLPEWQFHKAIALFATIGHHESGTRYHINGPKIRNKKSVHNGTYASGRYQVMEQNKRAWSKEYFGTVLPFTPENQDKIAFAKFAERFASYANAGLAFPTIIKEVAADWYGRWRAMPGQPTTSQYSSAIAYLYKEISYNFSPKFAMAGTLDEVAFIENDATIEEFPDSYETKKEPTILVRTSPEKEKPKIMVSTVAANDIQFEEEQTKTPLRIASLDGVRLNDVVSENTPEIEAPISQEVEFVPVASEVRNVARLLEKERKIEVMERVRNDTTIREDVRRSVLAKLEQAPDIATLCKTSIADYEKRKLSGNIQERAEALETLPKLYNLLRKVESDTTMVAGNDSGFFMKRAA